MLRQKLLFSEVTVEMTTDSENEELCVLLSKGAVVQKEKNVHMPYLV